MSHYATELARIHHAGFSDYAEAAAVEVVAQLLRKGVRGGVVVDAGCGTGVSARTLARAGFAVYGFDPSPAMVELARATAPAAQLRVGSLGEAAIPQCVAVMAVGEVVNYAGFEAFARFVAQAAGALEPGGMLFFDAALTSWKQLPQRHVTGDDWSVIIANERQENRLLRRVLTFRQHEGGIVRSDETHALELFDPAELDALLAHNHFTRERHDSCGTRRLPEGHAFFSCQLFALSS